MPATLQRTLDLRAADGRRLTHCVRPMVGVETWKAQTGRTEDELLAEIEAGRMLWAWDLAAEPGRRFIRYWQRSLECWLYPELSQPLHIEGVIELLLPAASAYTGTLRGTTLKRLFNCSSTHVMGLIQAGLIEARSGWKTGPLGSPEVSRASVEKLLRVRWLGAV